MIKKKQQQACVSITHVSSVSKHTCGNELDPTCPATHDLPLTVQVGMSLPSRGQHYKHNQIYKTNKHRTQK